MYPWNFEHTLWYLSGIVNEPSVDHTCCSVVCNDNLACPELEGGQDVVVKNQRGLTLIF